MSLTVAQFVVCMYTVGCRLTAENQQAMEKYVADMTAGLKDLDLDRQSNEDQLSESSARLECAQEKNLQFKAELTQ